MSGINSMPDALDNPPEPTERMKTAALTYQKIIAGE
jgi:uncharacterized protein (DUF1778 family)